MQGIEFETDQEPKTTYTNTAPKGSWAVKFLGRVGVSDTNTANFVILGIIAVLFGIAIFLYAGILSNGSIVPVDSLRTQQKI